MSTIWRRRRVPVALGTTLALQMATARGRIAKPGTGRETGRASDMEEGAMPRHRQVLAGVLVILIGIAFESWPYIVFGVAMALVPGNEWFTFTVGTDDGD